MHADMAAGTPVGELVSTCARVSGARLEGDLVIWRSTPEGRVAALDPQAAVGSVRLRSGDAVVLRAASSGAPAVPPSRRPETVAELVAVGGPRCGSRWPLAPGSVVLARDGQGDVVVGARAGRRIAVLEVAPGPVVRLAEAAAGLRVDGEVPPPDGTVLAAGAWLTTGADVITIRSVPTGGARRDVIALRPPRVGAPVAPAPVEMPEAPAAAPRSSVPAGVVLAPAVFAVVIAVVTRNPVYLLFGALAPLVGMWRLVADRRRGRRAHRRAVRRHAQEKLRADAALAEAKRTVRISRRAGMPDPAALVDRAVLERPTVWERRPHDPDFLEVRVGVGDLPSRVVVTPRSAAPAVDMSVPAAVPLSGGVLGIAGAAHERSGLARSIVLQAAVLHAPSEVAIAVVAARGDHTWDWTRLLPHHVAGTEIAAYVAAARDGTAGRHLLVVVDAGTDDATPPALAHAGGVGTSLVWCAPSRERLPGSCTHLAVFESSASARLATVADPAGAAEIVPDGVSSGACLTAARALAARADDAAADSSVPGTVGFVDALAELTGMDPCDPAAVAAHWQSEADGLPCLVGRSRSGLVCADLERDGPHALVVGTTGSGKSELFTTILASLAVCVSPQRLAFLLVDFKGGAAFDRLAEVPHSAGVVTDLDGDLSQRVLVSLEAEIRRRMQVLRDAGAVDIAACERTDPRHAPPRLAVVVDEFAALAREVPAFVDGLIDVARRGRSLGVHLLVGTQQPDVHTAKLADNTNLRVCLRVQDAGVSREVVATAAAARFPRDTSGRAIIARGHDDAIEVQTAWAGRAATRTRDLSVRLVGADRERAASAPGPGEPTELEAVVDAVVAAWHGCGGEPCPHRVWVPPPPEFVDLDDLPAGRPAAPVVGIADEPALQRVSPMRLDLAAFGSLLVTGRSGSGRTTLLRTIATAAARCGDVAVYALDCGDGGLADLANLARCADVVNGTEPERVDRLFAVLAGEAARRGSASASRSPRIVVVLDGFGTFAAAYDDWTGGHLATVRRLCEDGRGLGLHVVVAGDTASIPGRTRDAFGAVVELGVPGDATGPDGARWRVATAARIEKTANGAGEARRMPRIETLPTDAALSDLGAVAGVGPVLGIAGDTMEVVACDLDRVPLFLVAGPMRSGRSTALATLVQGVVGTEARARTALLAPRGGPLPDLGCWSDVAVGPEACTSKAADLAREVSDRVETAGSGVAGERLVIVVDDAEILADGPSAAALDVAARRCWDADVLLLAAVESHAAARSFGWLSQMRACRHGLVLQADPDSDSEVFRVRLPRRRGYGNIAGRGELVAGGAVRLVQVAR